MLLLGSIVTVETGREEGDPTQIISYYRTFKVQIKTSGKPALIKDKSLHFVFYSIEEYSPTRGVK